MKNPESACYLSSVLFALAAIPLPAAEAVPDTKRRNVLIIICDDLNTHVSTSGYSPIHTPATNPNDAYEGPCMFQRNGKYYFMWSEGNWTGPNYLVAYAIADGPLGPFKRIGIILQQDPQVATQ